MKESGVNFRLLVEDLVSHIPPGRVMTYGQIAAICGSPRASRVVGGIAHYGNPELPWHRVVNHNGVLATGYPGGREGQRIMLESEGVVVNSLQQVQLEKLLWHTIE